MRSIVLLTPMAQKKSCLVMLEASRCATLAAHSAAGVVVTQLPTWPTAKAQVKEAERLLRGAESLARLATSVLQTLTSSSTTAKPNDPGDVVMGNGNSDGAQTAPSSGTQSRRRRRRRKKTATVGEPPEEVLALTDTADVEPEPGLASSSSSRRSLRAHTSTSRSPPPSRTAFSASGAARSDLFCNPALHAKLEKVCQEKVTRARVCTDTRRLVPSTVFQLPCKSASGVTK